MRNAGGCGDASRFAGFALVEHLGERQHRGGLAQPRKRVDRDRPLGLVAVLDVAIDDVPQVLVQGDELRGSYRAQVRMPDTAAPVVSLQGCLAEGADLI